MLDKNNDNDNIKTLNLNQKENIMKIIYTQDLIKDFGKKMK